MLDTDYINENKTLAKKVRVIVAERGLMNLAIRITKKFLSEEEISYFKLL